VPDVPCSHPAAQLPSVPAPFRPLPRSPLRAWERRHPGGSPHKTLVLLVRSPPSCNTAPALPPQRRGLARVCCSSIGAEAPPSPLAGLWRIAPRSLSATSSSSRTRAFLGAFVFSVSSLVSASSALRTNCSRGSSHRMRVCSVLWEQNTDACVFRSLGTDSIGNSYCHCCRWACAHAVGSESSERRASSVARIVA
jgi:hypothetical protein